LATVAGVCLLIQVASATFLVRDVESPNAATRIARTLAAGEGYAIAPLPGGRDPLSVADPPRRAYHLPGEPLYLALGLRVLPGSLHRYLHVPIAMILIVAITVVALAAAGPRVAITAGVLASVDPFIVAHGPVWDDLFLASAAEWTLFAIAARQFHRVTSPGPRARRDIAPGSVTALAVVVLIAAVAAVTRMQSQALIGAAGLAAIVLPRARGIRWMGAAALVGIVIGVGAWSVRNQIVLGTPLAGTTHDGKTLFESTYATARATILTHGVAQNYDWVSAPPSLAGVERLDELEADRRFARAAWQYIRDHPFDVAVTGLFKIGVSLLGIDFSKPIRAPRNLVLITVNALLLVLGVWGLVVWKRHQPEATRFIVALAAIATCVTLLFLAAGPVGLRYRIGLTGFLYLGVAAWLRFRLGWGQPRR
jgi:hypothetical protein